MDTDQEQSKCEPCKGSGEPSLGFWTAWCLKERGQSPSLRREQWLQGPMPTLLQDLQPADSRELEQFARVLGLQVGMRRLLGSPSSVAVSQ